MTEWPIEVWLLLIPLLASALAWPVKTLWTYYSGRSDRREVSATELVELLRRALDKGRVRENGLGSACELLIVGIELLIEELEEQGRQVPSAVRRTYARAIEHLRAARDQCLAIEQGAKP